MAAHVRVPAAGEAVQGGWDGTWMQGGQQVTVNAASWNATIPANGGSVSIGFNGTDDGRPRRRPPCRSTALYARTTDHWRGAFHALRRPVAGVSPSAGLVPARSPD